MQKRTTKVFVSLTPCRRPALAFLPQAATLRRHVQRTKQPAARRFDAGPDEGQGTRFEQKAALQSRHAALAGEENTVAGLQRGILGGRHKDRKGTGNAEKMPRHLTGFRVCRRALQARQISPDTSGNYALFIDALFIATPIPRRAGQD